MPERSAEEQIIDGCWADGFDATDLLEEVKAQVRADERAKRFEPGLLRRTIDQAIYADFNSGRSDSWRAAGKARDAVLALEPEAREVTDERVEEAARGIHALRETPLTWDQEDEPTREYDRKRARAALEAAREVSRD